MQPDRLGHGVREGEGSSSLYAEALTGAGETDGRLRLDYILHAGQGQLADSTPLLNQADRINRVVARRHAATTLCTEAEQLL